MNGHVFPRAGYVPTVFLQELSAAPVDNIPVLMQYRQSRNVRKCKQVAGFTVTALVSSNIITLMNWGQS